MNSLKVDYLDAVFSDARKYTETANSDGTVSFTDVTEYTQEGDRFGATDINATNGAINSLAATKTATLASASWTGSAAPYSITVSVSGITATDSPIISLNLANNASAATTKSAHKCWGFITKIVTGSGTITAYAHTKPTVNLPIIIKGV